jgi:16S rRNA (uracil1498-N3)-methyltransferase
MAHVHRFYISAESVDTSDASLVLGGEEAHHALHVVRVKPSDEIEVIDGAGHVFRCEVESADRKQVACRILSTRDVEAPSRRLVWGQAWLNHPQTVEDIVKRGTALGVSEFIFFGGDHSERSPKLSDKWTRWAVESCKQCGRAWLPEFRVASDMDEALACGADVVLLASLDADGKNLADAVRDTKSVLMLIGPEGDFSAKETTATLDAGAVPVRLGEHTLRTELAGEVLATLVQYAWGELG